MNTPIEVWITKYALTEGIIHTTGSVSEDGKMVTCPSLGTYRYFHGKDRQWHRTLTDALVRADEMRLARVRSLERQSRQLQALAVKVVDR